MAIRAKSTVAISWSHYHHGRQPELRLVRIRNETFGYTFSNGLQGRVLGQYRQFISVERMMMMHIMPVTVLVRNIIIIIVAAAIRLYK
jgi:hypothetical protein